MLALLLLLLIVYFYFFIFYFSPSHLLPGHFHHILEISQIRGHRLGSSPPTSRPVLAFRFYRALGSAFPSLVNFHPSLFTHSRSTLSTRKVYIYILRSRSSFSIENSHSSEARTQETFHQESCSYPLSHMTIVDTNILRNILVVVLYNNGALY